MPTARMGTRGQVTIPKEIRDRLGLEPGHEIDFFFEREGRHVIMLAKTLDVRDLFGMLKPKDGRIATLEEIEEGIIKGATEGER